ncbi:MAG TPA: glycosyltransferase family 2 protein, partial [Gemmataceae bacterium]
ITRLIGYFADEKLGFVQTPHAFYNFDSFQASHDANKKTYWEEGDVFYNVIQLGKNQYNCPIFAGSAAMFRRKALEEIGYMAVETLTEDMHTGLRVNAHGWKSLAISERLIAGQAAPDVTTFHSQRLRWAKGNLSILAIDNPLTIPGLTLGQRLCHLASCLYWLGGLFRVPVYLTPLLFLFTGVSPVGEFTGILVILTNLYLLMTWSVVTLISKDRFSLWNSELFDMMSFWTKTRAVGALLWGSRGKFVVTSKRGRQSKSIWPLLRPHLVLVVVTLLALCWGWGRFLLGVSDDWGKLVLSTLWASFYMSLAFIVIRRALTPDDARYDYRHVVNLGLTYQVEGREPQPAAPRLAMTGDVSQGGLCILSYERLEPGTVLNIELHGAGEILHCHGRVAWSNELLRSESLPFQGFRNGVALEDLSPAQLDVLQHLCMHYAVSRQYYDIAARAARAGTANRQTLSLDGELKGPSFELHLPLMLEVPSEVNKTTYCCTEAVAQSGMNVLLPTPLVPGTRCTFSMSTPLGNLRGEVEAVRHDKLQLGGETYYLCTLSFLDVAEQGRAILDALIGPAEPGEELLTILKPRRQKRRLPVKSPLRIIALLVLPLLAAQTGAFYWYHADDLRLRDVITASVVNNGDMEDVRRISEQTDQQSHPSIDRLALLRRAWMRVGDEKQVDRLTDVLATRYPSNSELQIALLDVHVKNRDLERATAVYQHITNLFAYYFMPETRKKDLLMVIGRAHVHGGDYPTAADYFTRAWQMAPADRVLREEYAGVLLQNDRPQEVLALYGDDEKNTADRLLLAAAYQRLDHFDEAERECRLVLQEEPEGIPAHLQLAETRSVRPVGRKRRPPSTPTWPGSIPPTKGCGWGWPSRRLGTATTPRR